MGDLLVKLFVKEYDDVNNIKVRERYGILSAIVGLVCNIVLSASKFIVGFFAGSVSIVSDGFNNLSDCASCIITIFGYKMAAKPADKEHPFGHGRMEYLTALIMAVIIIIVGIELIKVSWLKILNPSDLTFSVVALVVLLASILVKLWIYFFNMKQGKKINSQVMIATAKDSMSDILATSVTVVALVASIWTKTPLDGIMGAIVSIFIIFSGISIIKETVDSLLGEAASPEMVDGIKEIVRKNPYALGMHDLIIHSYGPGNDFGTVHVEVNDKRKLTHTHDALDEIEREAYEKLGLHLTVHMDPVNLDDANIIKQKEMLNNILSKIDSELEMTDFRSVVGEHHTNLIFDLTVPFGLDISNDKIKKEIDDSLKDMEVVYITTITFNMNYCE